MKLTQLRYFQTICKHNNITRASNELHVSQPSLSNTIRDLEAEFGVALFYRLSKGLVLTEEGEFFLQEATRLLEQADQLAGQMNALGKANQTVRLGVPPMLASLVFPHILQAYLASFPNTCLKMIENGTLTNKKMVSDGTLDAAIISCDGSLPASFGSCDLCSLDIVFYVSIENPIAVNSSVSLSDLTDVPLVMLAEDCFLTDYLCQRFRVLNQTPNIILHTNQITAIQQLVERNAAATFLFDNLIPTDRNIVRLAVDDLPSTQIKLIWNKNRHLSSGTQNLIRLARSEFGGLLCPPED
ncbi:MAG: LysR family transcriptional regulator [Clostridiales bacterium]|nr:LysR family transcriptional regulator [Clostridiales bacterium]